MKKRQQGMTSVEAAIGAALMLIVLFGTIEIARAIFVWNFMDEATRRGARVAAVCPIDHPAAPRVAVFAPPGGPDASPHVRRLTASDIIVEYLDAGGTPGSGFEETRFVRVALIDDFKLPLLFFNKVEWDVPEFRTILPSESLGYNPDSGTITCECFDTKGPLGSDGCG